MSTTTAIRTIEGLELPAPGEWTIDPSHSAVTFSSRHLGVGKVRGRFKALEGTLRIGERPQDSEVEVRIDAASIDTGTEQRDDHLRSPDFLDVERYPHLTYRSTALERTGEDGFVLQGELTIRDVTRPVDLEVTYDGAGHDPWGGTRTAFTARAEIDREDFGITWNQVLETGGFLVGRKVRIEIEVEAARAAAKAA